MPDDNKITISVVIPAYNAEKTIARTVESVLKQSYPATEVIVVDDGSQDQTRAVLESYGSKIRYLYQENAGVSAARNTGVRAAQGEWIAFLDADDEWLEHHLAQQVEVLRHDPSLVWVSSNFYRCFCTRNLTQPNIAEEKAKQLMDNPWGFASFWQAVRHFPVCWTGAMLIKKKNIEEAGGFSTTLHHGEEDIDLWWRIAYQEPKVGFAVEPSVIYHMEIGGSLSQNILPREVFQNLIDKHLSLSRQWQRQDDFFPLARYMVERWLRASWFRGDSMGVREVLGHYPFLLDRRFRMIMHIMLLWPGLSWRFCRGLSWLNQHLHLRGQIHRQDITAISGERHGGH